MEGNHNLEGNSVERHEDPQGPHSRPPSPRTALNEIKKVPLVADGIDKVVGVHGRLKNILPFYGILTSLVLQTACGVWKRVEPFVVIQWTEELADCVMLGIIDFMTNNFPVISLPTQELFGKINMYLKKKVSVIVSHVASYSLPQRICRIVESILKKLEDFGCAFTVNEESRLNIPWWYAPNLILAAYECTVNSVLLFGIKHINGVRQTVRNVRISGEGLVDSGNQASFRRRVSPRKSSKSERLWFGYRLFVWLKNKIYMMMGHTTDVISASFISDSSVMDTPDKNISSREKKRKLSDVDEEYSPDSSEEMTCGDLMTSLGSYYSERDPDYLPSSPSTDSYEYKFSSEEECEECTENSTLESYNELELIVNGKGKNDPSKSSATPKTDEPVLLKKTPRNTEDLVGNASDTVNTENGIYNHAEDQVIDGVKSTSTPEAKRKSILRW